ncbi:rhomboid family intramembrane serine protease [Kineococcus sp. NPDC059986]|jgi:membrane associated rhomboid family serine protease|uniref:rhomboid family intramembrane serine protease n=1 Tax=Kineococcus sp. NPDC059986 TaxID=3155538 RepID=UPI00344DCCA4
MTRTLTSGGTGSARADRRRRRRFPVATVALVVPVTGTWVAQLAHPALLEVLRRDPSALAAGQWWRVVTPLVVQDPPWQWAVLAPATLVLGTLVERFAGSRAVVAGFLCAGLVGEAAGYAWSPYGAGSSVGAAGLLGILVAWSLSAAARRALPPVLVPRVRFFAVATLAAAAVSVALRDVHGLPLFTGALLGVALTRRRTG